MWELALALRQVRKSSEALQLLRTSYQHLEQELGADNDTTKMVKRDLEIAEVRSSNPMSILVVALMSQ
jgi:hypothetical protein